MLELLAAEAREVAGLYDTQRAVVAKWRTELERSLLFAHADSALQALGARGCTGWDRQAFPKVGIFASVAADPVFQQHQPAV